MSHIPTCVQNLSSIGLRLMPRRLDGVFFAALVNRQPYPRKPSPIARKPSTFAKQRKGTETGKTRFACMTGSGATDSRLEKHDNDRPTDRPTG